MTSFENSQIRQSTIWSPFEYYGSYNDVQEAERAIIFGLYSNSWRNDDGYMQGVYDIDMANILSDYTAKVAELTVDEQKVVADISAKRYISGIETLVHDGKMATQLQKIDADADEWDAKIAALAADRAALETLRVKIASEIKRIAARILELEAYIQVEKANLELVNVEISEKEVQLARKDLQLVEKALEESRKEIAILQAGNEIAKIQLQIVEAGLELIDVDMKVARTNLDIQQTENQIAKAVMAESELDIAKARTEAERSDLSVIEKRVDLAKMQVDSIAKEISGVAAASSDEDALYNERLNALAAKQNELIQSIANRTETALFAIKEKEISSTLEKSIGEKTNTTQAITDLDKIRERYAQFSAAKTTADAVVAAAEKLAEANVASTLIHSIKKAP